MAHGTFFTSVGCMDGRVQKVVCEFGQRKFNAEFPDTITDAGLVGKLSRSTIDDIVYSAIKEKLLISIEKHNSRGIIVHGHEECAGNPVDEKTQWENIRKSAEMIRAMVEDVKPEIEIIQVFVKVNPQIGVEVE